MQYKLLITAFAILLLLLMVLFALVNPSYEKAFRAKWYFASGEYDKALTLAKEAYELDPYNRVALTVMKRTEIAKKFEDFIKEGERYLKQIETIANNPPIKSADKIRIKMMCEIIIDKYSLLTPSMLIDDTLIKRAKDIYEKFDKLFISLFGKTKQK